MKIVFNDATELTVQKVSVDPAGALRIKTVSATQEQLRNLFSDDVKTKKITVMEQGQMVGDPYEGYTQFDGIMAYTGGILEPVLYKVGETPEERITVVEQKMNENAEEITATQIALVEVYEMLVGGEENA